MATVKGLMVPGNNQTLGQSAFTMTHPGLFNYLDYPDVASIACPKPMLFYNGERDVLFPVASVQEAYAKIAGCGDNRESATGWQLGFGRRPTRSTRRCRMRHSAGLTGTLSSDPIRGFVLRSSRPAPRSP